MTETGSPSLSSTPGVIPYVEWHTGPRRTLTVGLTTGNSVVGKKYRPIVSVDGRQYVVVWGPVTFEAPADRNVHLSVHLEGDIVGQVASLLLPPSGQDLRFRYETHYNTGVGTLTPDPGPQA
ncbi:hypothetical protein [Nocardioides sp. InS609-2]|uniref:hypothetical protein n=1 Tax=Nocardioides sp. InS609-2 TaxID=2760705 RepID=UPI0020BFA689|nr:hypothetical protein [Nocardioides sp. InS609-2]